MIDMGRQFPRGWLHTDEQRVVCETGDTQVNTTCVLTLYIRQPGTGALLSGLQKRRETLCIVQVMAAIQRHRFSRELPLRVQG